MNAAGKSAKKIHGDPELDFALTCIHCNDTCDSFGKYVSTYCHRKNANIAGFPSCGPLPCRSCPDYAERKE